MWQGTDEVRRMNCILNNIIDYPLQDSFVCATGKYGILVLWAYVDEYTSIFCF